MSEINSAVLATADTDEPASGRSFRLSGTLLWVVVFAILGLLGWGLVNTSRTRPEPGQRAPAFEMRFFDGYEWQGRNSLALSELEGKVVVVNFWAAWCVECKVEAALLENSWRKYRDQDVVFVGIAYADVEPNSLQYLEDYDITYPNAPDLGTTISEDYEITGVPETFFIDRNGTISYVHLGPVTEPLLNGTIEQLLVQEG